MPNEPMAQAGRAASGETATAEDYRRAAEFHKACETGLRRRAADLPAGNDLAAEFLMDADRQAQLAASNLRQADERDGSGTGRGVARKSRFT